MRFERLPCLGLEVEKGYGNIQKSGLYIMWNNYLPDKYPKAEPGNEPMTS